MTAPILVGRIVPPVVQFAWVVDGAAVVDADLTAPAESLEAGKEVLDALGVPEFPVVPGQITPFWSQYLEDLCKS